MTRFFLGCILGTAALASAASYWPFPHGIEVPTVLLTPHATAPDTCTATTVGVLYYDTTGSNPCVCNGTDWVDVKDASTTCA
jgi:hypothetical protein